MLDYILGLLGQSLPNMLGSIGAGIIGAAATAALDKLRNRDDQRDDPDETPDDNQTAS
ncbi:hypothetical protein ACIOG7_01830 [Streptomyces sp. NPDC087894]|uniref:hypothetical protein n=1 Tax=Streptomyces sp. NPDC087894 TaxID=3365816 RepID=UPI0037F37143